VKLHITTSKDRAYTEAARPNPPDWEKAKADLLELFKTSLEQLNDKDKLVFSIEVQPNEQ
jgi:hypothetical protein